MSGWTVVAISVAGGLALDLLWPSNPLSRLGAALYDRTLGRRWRQRTFDDMDAALDWLNDPPAFPRLRLFRSHSEKPRSGK